MRLFIVFLSLICLFVVKVMSQTDSTEMDEEVEHLIQKPVAKPNLMRKELDGKHSFYGIFAFNTENPILLTLWVFTLYLIIASLIKLGYHQSNFLTTTIPESCALIIIGIGFGTLIKIFDLKDVIPNFTVNLFLFGLLPPIILQSAFTLHNEYFFENLITILMYAVVGTLINVFLIGMSLHIFSLSNFRYLEFPKISLIELLIFSNAISAVDPVTVLTIFQDLKVNKPLYYLVFGESLLNDAVVIVVHSLLDSFVSAPIISSKDIITGFNSFFFTSVGGLIIGILFGLLTALITLYTKHSLVIEPMVVITLAYSSYVTADLITWSGLISLIGCGLVQYEFAFRNISQKTKATVKYFISTLSAVCDLLIFFFLGQIMINNEMVWNSSFVLLTIGFCLLYRTVSVLSLTYISNNYFHRTRSINWEEQALMSYGGLRGAVAFAMIALLEENKDIENRPLFQTTTFVLILFSVFILGGTTKPLLNILRIQREAIDTKKLCFVLNDKVTDIVINGIEDFVGNPSPMNVIKHKLMDLIKCLRKYLCQTSEDPKLEFQIRKIQSETKLLDKTSSSLREGSDTSVVEPKRPNIEDSMLKIEKFNKKIDTNKEVFRNIVSHKLNTKTFISEDVNRKHTIPKELFSRVIATNQEFKSDKKLFALRSDMNSKEIIKRFKQTEDKTNKKDRTSDSNVDKKSK